MPHIHVPYSPGPMQYATTRRIPGQASRSIARWIANAVEGLAPWPDPLKAQALLDLGCGQGRFLRPLMKTPLTVVGVDVSFEMLDECKRLDPASCVVLGDAVQLPFADRRFDAILIVSVLQLLSDSDLILCMREVVRVLRRGGLVLYGATKYQSADAKVYERIRFEIPSSINRRSASGRPLRSFADEPARLQSALESHGWTKCKSQPSQVAIWDVATTVAQLVREMEAGVWSESFWWLEEERMEFRRLVERVVPGSWTAWEEAKLSVQKQFTISIVRDGG